jgi:O-antigen/teichoic acid export membrane protein
MLFALAHSRLMTLLRRAEMDRAVALAILGNIVSLVFGPVTALLIATRFSPELQGYYYTFGSLTALQFFVELGLGQAIIQFASHEWVGLGFDTRKRIVGSAYSLSRLISLGHLSLKWYTVAAVLVLLFLGPGGYLFFSRSPTPGIDWMWPWFALCFGLALNLVLTPMFFLLQGCNQVSQFWFYRLVQQALNGMILWIAILVGARLWASPIAMAAGLLWSVIFLLQYKPFFRTFLARPTGPRIIWRTEVWPIQWRIAISWFSTYFTSQFFTPVLFKFSGPIVAGQMGLTNTLANVLVAISSNWVVTKAPRFGGLIAQRQFKELDRSFFRSLTMSGIVACVGAVAGAGFTYILYRIGNPLSTRILPPLPATLFFLAGAVSAILAGLAVYLRAHKKEPLVGIFLTGSVLIIILTLWLAPVYSTTGIAAGYLSVLALYELPVCLWIFRHSRTIWHGQDAGETGVIT